MSVFSVAATSNTTDTFDFENFILEDLETIADLDYFDYIGIHRAAGFNGEIVTIPVLDPVFMVDSNLMDDLDGRPAIATGEESFVEWEFNVPQTGLYRIELDYFPTEGRGDFIERAIYINGELPFSEAFNISFSRVFINEGPIVAGFRGDDLRPRQIELPRWQTATVHDRFKYFGEALYFHLEAGTNRIAFSALREPFAIAEIRLISEELTTISYNEYRAAHSGSPVQGVLEDGLIFLHAVTADYKSDPTLYPMNDNTSSANIPFDVFERRLNVVGGTHWNRVGQWMAWNVYIPQSGYYNIGMRSKQNINRDMNSYRTLFINGEVPFEEVRHIPFEFSDRWSVDLVGGSDPHLFYFTAGWHEIKLAVSLGHTAEIVMYSERVMTRLNGITLDLVSLMGTNPDPDRSYQLFRFMPELLVTMEEVQGQLIEIRDELLEHVGGRRDAMISQLDQLIFVLGRMYEDCDRVASLFERYRQLTAVFADWIANARIKPLLLNYIFIAEEGATLPRGERNFFINLWYGFLGFISTFFIDSTAISDDNFDGDALTVWLGAGLAGGRDQALALNRMILEDFTSVTGIPVRLQLVPPGTLLPAVLAGRGPDIALQLGGGQPVDFALRNAVHDLTQFADFEEVAQRFHPETLLPFRLGDGVFALPETFNFPMMFYRRDILRDMGIDIRDVETWDDMLVLLATLQNDNMAFGLHPTFGNFVMFLYQMNGQLYTDDLRESNLLNRTSIAAFSYWMELYTHHGLWIAFDFMNRFRTGEMPVGVADYTAFNTIALAAPEIAGQWGMRPIPGMRQEDGTINNTAPVFTTGTGIMYATTNPDDAWEFLKWWTSSDAQFMFGRELETVLGPAARYPTANLDAMMRLPWAASDRRQLLSQMEMLQGIPEVPGGWYTMPRYIEFARIAVLDRDENPRSVLMDYNDRITTEIQRRRAEFGLD